MKKLLNKKGFTIVELVIVIAVIAILAAVLIPTFSNVIENANETATLQEARSTLDSYIGVMSADGSSLPEGTVFVVFDSEADANAATINKSKISGAFVYYKGALHKFNYDDIVDTNDEVEVPLINEETNSRFKANKKIVWTNSQIKDFSGASIYNFYFYDGKAVKFDGGSTKCKIYGGRIKALVEMVRLTSTASYFTMPAATKGVYTIVNNIETSSEKQFTLTVNSEDIIKNEVKWSYKLDDVVPTEKEISVTDGTTEKTFTIKAGTTGKLVITVESGTAKTTLEVQLVTPVSVSLKSATTGFTLTEIPDPKPNGPKYTIDVKKGNKFTLAATTNPEKGYVTWVSSDTNVATVSNGNFEIKGAPKSTATITVKYGNQEVKVLITVTE